MAYKYRSISNRIKNKLSSRLAKRFYRRWTLVNQFWCKVKSLDIWSNLMEEGSKNDKGCEKLNKIEV